MFRLVMAWFWLAALLSWGNAQSVQAAETPTPIPPTSLEAPLPRDWVVAFQLTGIQVATTADITPEMMFRVINIGPELFHALPSTTWRRLPPTTLIMAVPAASDQLPPALREELTVIYQAARGRPITPVLLPTAWRTQTALADATLNTTADLTPALMQRLVTVAPELLPLLERPHLLALDPLALATLPSSFIASLEKGLQDTLIVITARALLAQATPPPPPTTPVPTLPVSPTPAADNAPPYPYTLWLALGGLGVALIILLWRWRANPV